MHLRLVRVAEHKDATLGVLCLDGHPMFVTLEDKWRDNERNVSCIPKGSYIVALHKSPKFGKCYQVVNVPNRSDILIHAGNTHVDTQGCILLGMMYGSMGTANAILSSRTAVTAFMHEMNGVEAATLEVV